MTKIIGIAGGIGSGKTSLCNYLHGYILKENDIIDSFDLDNKGRLLVPTIHNGKKTLGVLDLEQKNFNFFKYAERMIWPYIKSYGFAEYLKQFLIRVFGLKYNQCFGSQEEKSTGTKIRWENIRKVLGKKKCDKFDGFKKGRKYISARELLQLFGTEICRTIMHDCWANECLNRIQNENPQIAIIPDVRFPNELKKIQENKGIVVKLTRFTEDSKHDSENALKNSQFDWILDNQHMDVLQQGRAFIEHAEKSDWI